MILFADLTERKIQECVKLGIAAEFGTTSIRDGKAHYNRDGCDDVTKKAQGLVFVRKPIILIGQACNVGVCLWYVQIFIFVWLEYT